MKRILCFISLLLGIIAVNAQNIAEIEAQADKWAEKSYTRSNALSAYLQCIKQTDKKEVHIRIMKKTSKILEQATYLFDEEASVVDSIISIISKAHPKFKKGNQYYISLIEQRILSRSNTKDFNQKFTLCKEAIEIRKRNNTLYGAEYEQLLYWYINTTKHKEESPATEIVDFCTNLCDIQKVNNPQIDSLYINMLNYRAGLCYSRTKDYQTATYLYEKNREFIEIKKGKSCKEYIEVLTHLGYSYSNLYEELYGVDCYDLKPEKEKELAHKYELLKQKILLDLEIYDFEFNVLLDDIEKYKKDYKVTIHTATELKNILQQKTGERSKQYYNLLDRKIKKYSTCPTSSAYYLFIDFLQKQKNIKIEFSKVQRILDSPIDYFKDTIVARSIATDYKTLLEEKYGKENGAYCEALKMEINTYQENDADAIPLLEELLALQEKLLGKESAEYHLTQTLLTIALDKNHQKQEAIAVHSSNINEEDIDQLSFLAHMQSEYGNHREAIKIYERELEHWILNPKEEDIYFKSTTGLIVLSYHKLNDADGLLEFSAKWCSDSRLDKNLRKYILGETIDWIVTTNKSADEIINFTDKYLSPLTDETEYLEYKVNIYLAKNQPAKAEEVCRQLILLARNNNSDIQTIIKCEQYLELCLIQKGDLEKAFEQNKKIQSIIGQRPDYKNSIEYYRLRCCEIIYQDIKKNFDEVLRIYTEIVNFDYTKHYTIFTYDEVSTILRGHAKSDINTGVLEIQIYRALYNKGLIDDAEELIDKELADWIAITKYSLTQMLKGSAISTDILNNFAVLSNKDSLIIKAFDCTLLQKQAFLTAEAIMNQQILNSGNKELVEKYNNLQNLRLSIQQYKANGLPTDELDEQALVLHTQLVEDSKFYGDFTKSLNLTWKDIQEILKPDEIAIEFISYASLEDNNKHIAALILRSGWDVPKVVKLFSEKDIPGNIYDNSDFSKLCWGPISKYLDNVKNIYFAPDGALYNIGIESLLNPNGKGYMADKYNLYRISSTRELVMRPEKNRTEKQKAIIYGGIDYKHQDIVTASSTEQSEQTTENIEIIRDIRGAVSGISYLPGTKSEAESIATILNSDKRYDEARLFTGANGTEQSFRAFSGEGINVAHIATHGFYRKDDKEQNQSILTLTPPEDNTLTRAGLLFAGAENTIFADSTYSEENDGILTALEISTLDLSTLDIITLGACQTAIGEITSDGVFGLQRGFKKAGVNTILMSLWSVDDNATTLFMTEFYKNWINGKSKHDALESAKKVVRSHKEKGWDNPKYWAPFILLDGLD